MSNYWHIQLHPDDRSTFTPELIKQILIEKGVIGLGEWEKGEDKIKQFKNIKIKLSKAKELILKMRES